MHDAARSPEHAPGPTPLVWMFPLHLTEADTPRPSADIPGTPERYPSQAGPPPAPGYSPG